MIDIKLPAGREVVDVSQDIMPDGETVKIIINTRKSNPTQVVLNVIATEPFIPKAGDYFRPDSKVSDKSWSRNVFKCLAASDDMIIGEIVDRDRSFYKRSINLVIKNYEFKRVSDDIVREVSK